MFSPDAPAQGRDEKIMAVVRQYMYYFHDLFTFIPHVRKSMYTPTPEEQEWIDKSQDPHMASMCAQIAAGFNRMDFRLIGAVLDDECTYGSQTVDIPLRGKLAIGDYLTGHFKAKKSGEGLGRAFAQLARDSSGEDPCVLFHQRESEFGHIGLGDLFGYISIKCNDAGKVIECFTVSLLPEPESCTFSHLYPGLTKEDLEVESKFQGLKLPLTTEVSFVLFMLIGDQYSHRMQDSVQKILTLSPMPFLQYSAEDPNCALHKVHRFPTLDIVYQHEIAKRIIGYHDPGPLIGAVAHLFDDKGVGARYSEIIQRKPEDDNR